MLADAAVSAVPLRGSPIHSCEKVHKLVRPRRSSKQLLTVATHQPIGTRASGKGFYRNVFLKTIGNRLEIGA
jgi:hypothetical protein